MTEMNNVWITGVDVVIGSTAESDDDQNRRLNPSDCFFTSERPDYHYCDKTSRMLIGSSARLLNKLGIVTANDVINNFGIVVGSEFGPLDSIHQFDMKALTDGALSVNPSLFPNTVLNSTSCRTGIFNSFDGLIQTVYNGVNSSLDAIGLGYQYVKHNELPLVLTGGYDELTDLNSTMIRRTSPCGEACGLVTLEKKLTAMKEHRLPLAEVVDYRSVFVSDLADDRFWGELLTYACSLMKNSVRAFGPIKSISISSIYDLATETKVIDFLIRHLDSTPEVHHEEVDWLGANGIVQLSKMLQSMDDGNGGPSMILNLGDSKLSCLTIMHKGSDYQLDS